MFEVTVSCSQLYLQRVWIRSTIGERTAVRDILQPVQYTPPPSHFKTNHLSSITITRQALFPPFPIHHNQKMCRLQHLSSLRRSSFHGKTGRTRPLNALCDVLAENTPALPEDTRHLRFRGALTRPLTCEG